VSGQFHAPAILQSVKYPDLHLNRRLLGPQNCLDAFEKRKIPLLEQCVFFGSHVIDGQCCSSALKERKILFNLEMKILLLGDNIRSLLGHNISSLLQAKRALNPTHLSPIRKGVLSLKKSPVSSTATQAVEQVLYCRHK
jgi:hypothetical protein